MFDIFGDFLFSVYDDALNVLDGVLLDILDGVLRIENLSYGALNDVLSTGSVNGLYLFLYTFAGVLVALKFLWRGFEIWILWRNGDADNSPQDMLIGIVQAVVVMVSFPFLYDILADVTTWATESILFRMGLATFVVPPFSMLGQTIRTSFVCIIMAIVYVILSIVLYIKLLRRGFELLILRLGIPFACLGLLDSDYGLFRNYLQTLFRTLMTSALQVILVSASSRLLSSPSLINLILSLTILCTAYSTPQLLQNLLIPTARGGGITNKIYSVSMAARSIRGLMGR